MGLNLWGDFFKTSDILMDKGGSFIFFRGSSLTCPKASRQPYHASPSNCSCIYITAKTKLNCLLGRCTIAFTHWLYLLNLQCRWSLWQPNWWIIHQQLMPMGQNPVITSSISISKALMNRWGEGLINASLICLSIPTSPSIKLTLQNSLLPLLTYINQLPVHAHPIWRFDNVKDTTVYFQAARKWNQDFNR